MYKVAEQQLKINEKATKLRRMLILAYAMQEGNFFLLQ
jgi:hypothetical protein